MHGAPHVHDNTPRRGGLQSDYLNPLFKCVRLRSGVVVVARYHHQAAQYTYSQRCPYSHVRYRAIILFLQLLYAKVLVFLQCAFAVLREKFSVYLNRQNAPFNRHQK